MTAFPAAAEDITTEGRPSASLSRAFRFASSATYNGLSLSDPNGLIILLFSSLFVLVIDSRQQVDFMDELLHHSFLITLAFGGVKLLLFPLKFRHKDKQEE
jgi:hypothetical protein